MGNDIHKCIIPSEGLLSLIVLFQYVQDFCFFYASFVSVPVASCSGPVQEEEQNRSGESGV